MYELPQQNNSWIVLSRNPEEIKKNYTKTIQWINKDCTSLIFKSVRFPKPEIFLELF